MQCIQLIFSQIKNNAILPKTVENPDSSRNVSIFNFCKFALPPVVAHHHHSKLTLSLSAPSYYLGISKVILNNINLPHQRGKNYVVNYLAQKSGSTTHLGAKSCGHPWWCPPPGCTAVSDNLTFCVEVRGGPDHVMEVRSKRWSQNCVVLQIDKVYQSHSDWLLEKVYTKNIPWPKLPEQLVTCLFA